MTKSEEKAILAATAKKLGKNSYSGMWLETIIPVLFQNIDSDLSVDELDPFVIRQANEELTKRATVRAEEIIKNAERTANLMQENARKKADEWEEYTRCALRRALKGMGE